MDDRRVDPRARSGVSEANPEPLVVCEMAVERACAVCASRLDSETLEEEARGG